MKITIKGSKSGLLPALVARLFNTAVSLGTIILLCSSASAQNLFVSGNGGPNNCFRSGCGVVYTFNWDGAQSIFAFGLTAPWDVGFDSGGNLFVVDYDREAPLGDTVIYKITPNGARSVFATGLSYPSYLAVDGAGNVFAADYNQGIIYRYKPTGSRSIFASGLHHPVGMAVNSSGELFVVDNSAGNIYQGHIYQYKPNGSRATFATLDAFDRPADLAFDSLGRLYVADLGGKIYRYGVPGVLLRHSRITFGSVPGSAQSLAFDSVGNLLVVDAGDVNSAAAPNAIYKFTQNALRSSFAAPLGTGESFACLAFRPMGCCQ
jgi:DNA-binding beta-propeller fold protein YncE